MVVGFVVQPLWLQAIVKVKPVFVVSSDRSGLHVLRAVLYRLSVEANVDFRIVHDKPVHMADFAINRINVITRDSLGTTQM